MPKRLLVTSIDRYQQVTNVPYGDIELDDDFILTEDFMFNFIKEHYELDEHVDALRLDCPKVKITITDQYQVSTIFGDESDDQFMVINI